MRRIMTVLSVVALALALAAPDAKAQTTTSGGQAIVAPFHLFYSSSTERIDFSLQVANLSNDTVHVRVTYFDQLGAVAKTEEFDLNARQAKGSSLSTASTPGTTPLNFYASIEWTGPFSARKPMIAHAYTRYYVQTGTFRAQDVTSIPINCGMPF